MKWHLKEPEVNKSLDKQKTVIIALYTIGLIGMVFVLFAVFASRTGKVKSHSDYMDISDGWTLDSEGTTPARLDNLGEYIDAEKGVLSLYYKLPEFDEKITLMYRSKDVSTRVFIDGENIYETSVFDSRFYNKSPGNLWNTVDINSKYSKKVIEVQILMVYDKRALTFDSVYLGNEADIIISLLNGSMIAIFISFLLIVLAVFLIAYDLLPVNRKIKNKHSIFWLGLFSLITGIWSLIETNIVQFFVNDMRIIQLIDNMAMLTEAMPLLIYIDSEYELFRHRVLRILGYIGGAFTLFCAILQISGFGDLHNVIIGASVQSFVIDAIMMVWGILIVLGLKNKDDSMSMTKRILILIGVGSLSFFGFFEVMRSSRTDTFDRAGLVRVGMLLLIICFAISSQVDFYKLLKQGTEFELISTLAYSDGLTGLGNRTAYLEQLEEYANNEGKYIKFGVVYLDVNNLKKVNDNLGHEMGDTLIKIAANIIADSFGKYGKSYRTGGDEFCVMMTGNDLADHYEKGLEVFNQLINEANQAKWYPFEVQIAHGFAACDDFSHEKIDETVALADNEMYKNKTLLKSGVATVVL